MRLKHFIVIFSLLIFARPQAEAQMSDSLDSLFLELENPHHDTIIFELLLEIGDNYYFNEPDTAKAYFIKARNLAEKNLKSPGKLKETFIRKKGKAIIYIAYIYSSQGNYIKALDKYFQTLELGESISCNLLIYNSYNNIGIINHRRKVYDIAMDYYSRALAITEGMDHDVGSVKLYNNLGVLHYEMGKDIGSIPEKEEYFQAANEYFIKTLRIRKELNDLWGQALCYNNLGKLTRDRAELIENEQLKRSKLSEAIDYFRQSIQIAKDIKDLMSHSNAYGNMSKLYLMIYNLNRTTNAEKKVFADRAVYFATEAHLLAEELNSLSQIKKTALFAKNAYAVIGDLDKALHYADIYIETSEELFSEDKTRSLDEMRIRYETEKKENEIKLLSQENELKEILILSAKRDKVLFITIAVSFLGLSLLLYILYSNRKKTGLLLEEKNDKLDKLNTTKDKFISILAHDLKNPFSSLLNLTAALNNDFSEIDNKDKKRIIGQLHQSAEYLNKLLKNMLEWAVIKHNSLLPETEKLNLYEATEDTINALKGFIEENGSSVENKIDKDIVVLANRANLAAILNNLLTNAVKFSFNNKLVSLFAFKNNNYTTITVADKGIGISPEDIEKLFRIDVDSRSIGSPQGKGTGMGLIICKELVENMKGKIWVESKVGEGTRFVFSLPTVD